MPKAAARIDTVTLFLLANTEGKQNASVNENGHLLQPKHLHRAGSSLSRSPRQETGAREALESTTRESLKSCSKPNAAGTSNLSGELNSGSSLKRKYRCREGEAEPEGVVILASPQGLKSGDHG